MNLLRIFGFVFLALTSLTEAATDQWTIAPAEFYEVGPISRYHMKLGVTEIFSVAPNSSTDWLMPFEKRPWSEDQTLVVGQTNASCPLGTLSIDPVAAVLPQTYSGSQVSANVAAGFAWRIDVSNGPLLEPIFVESDLLTAPHRFRTEWIPLTLADLTALPIELSQRAAVIKAQVPQEVRDIAAQIVAQSNGNLTDILQRISEWLYNNITYDYDGASNAAEWDLTSTWSQAGGVWWICCAL